jgi:hypothetical protein
MLVIYNDSYVRKGGRWVIADRKGLDDPRAGRRTVGWAEGGSGR